VVIHSQDRDFHQQVLMARPLAFPQQGYGQPGYPTAGGYPGMQPGIPQMGFQMPIRPNDIVIEQPDGDKGMNHIEGLEFTDKTIRRAFIRKVYFILFAMLVVATGFVLTFSHVESIRMWSRANRHIYILSVVGLLITTLILACCEGVRRKAPWNFICLSLFTLAASFSLGAVSSYFKAESVLLAVGITAVVCLGLTLFAFQTKWDFTKLNGALFVAVLILFVLSLVGIFLRDRYPWWHLMIAGFSAVLFSLYLIHDTQMMMGGNHKYQISPEEYIFAALTLFLDIYNIFLAILTLVGDR